jgi:hypothetical protein
MFFAELNANCDAAAQMDLSVVGRCSTARLRIFMAVYAYAIMVALVLLTTAAFLSRQDIRDDG